MWSKSSVSLFWSNKLSGGSILSRKGWGCSPLVPLWWTLLYNIVARGPQCGTSASEPWSCDWHSLSTSHPTRLKVSSILVTPHSLSSKKTRGGSFKTTTDKQMQSCSEPQDQKENCSIPPRTRMYEDCACSSSGSQQVVHSRYQPTGQFYVLRVRTHVHPRRYVKILSTHRHPFIDLLSNEQVKIYVVLDLDFSISQCSFSLRDLRPRPDLLELLRDPWCFGKPSWSTCGAPSLLSWFCLDTRPERHNSVLFDWTQHAFSCSKIHNWKNENFRTKWKAHLFRPAGHLLNVSPTLPFPNLVEPTCLFFFLQL